MAKNQTRSSLNRALMESATTVFLEPELCLSGPGPGVALNIYKVVSFIV